jgi:hypothetical protein
LAEWARTLPQDSDLFHRYQAMRLHYLYLSEDLGSVLNLSHFGWG